MVDVNRWASLGSFEIPVNEVLLIEDDAELAAHIKQALEHNHVMVRVAKDGGQAKASFTMHRPDFVILDLILPGESGFEICERLKQADETVPVLVLTAIDMDDARELAARVGADGYLCKPVDPEHLVATIKELTEQVWQRTHLGEPNAESDRIRFTCSCGKRFKVSSSHRGKNMICPQCGEPLTVPKWSA
ncbi:MAG TPA: response regulator [Planctomycetaceae bacterium]|nr:response regulator [Planctomycetaceae bacterium]